MSEQATPPTSPILPIERKAMQQALDLAATARGHVEPNPMVGAALIDPSPAASQISGHITGHSAGQILALGHHARFGEAHAERNCLANAREQNIDPRGKTMVVTLEPCCHHGKQPPCTDALIESGITRVVIAMVDPYLEVSGGGIAKLQAAGIETVVLDEADELAVAARDLTRAFIKHVKMGLPYVTLKWAQTLDGYIATRTGDSQWISGSLARQHVHAERAVSDAILVGIGTALKDNPSLTARDQPEHLTPPPRLARRVVVDPNADLPIDCKLLQDAGPPVTIATCQPNHPASQHNTPTSVEVITLPQRPDQTPDLKPLLQHLADAHDTRNILAEGGAGLHTWLLQQQLADRCWTFIAPRFLGDPQAKPCIHPLTQNPITEMPNTPTWTLHHTERLDNDVMLDLRST